MLCLIASQEYTLVEGPGGDDAEKLTGNCFQVESDMCVRSRMILGCLQSGVAEEFIR